MSRNLLPAGSGLGAPNEGGLTTPSPYRRGE